MDDTCSSLPQVHPTLVIFAISCRLSAICDTGVSCAEKFYQSFIVLRRRALARTHLKPNEIPLTFTSFPHLGVQGHFTEPYFNPNDAVSSHSFFLPEEITNPHARFPYVPLFLLHVRTFLTLAF
jgi:hypothetical protein